MSDAIDAKQEEARVASVVSSILAPYANKIYAFSFPSGMKLTFVEVNPADQGVEVARSAVFLAFNDVEALVGLLNRQMKATTKKSTWPPSGACA